MRVPGAGLRDGPDTVATGLALVTRTWRGHVDTLS
jgi:hypothetical protein